ncbi:hypothetical protein [Ancylobacter sp. IITR112]
MMTTPREEFDSIGDMDRLARGWGEAVLQLIICDLFILATY